MRCCLALLGLQLDHAQPLPLTQGVLLKHVLLVQLQNKGDDDVESRCWITVQTTMVVWRGSCICDASSALCIKHTRMTARAIQHRMCSAHLQPLEIALPFGYAHRLFPQLVLLLRRQLELLVGMPASIEFESLMVDQVLHARVFVDA